MTDVAVIGFAQSPCVRRSDSTTSGVEMLVPIFQQVLASTGLAKEDIGFWCSGSSDYLAGRAFSFVQAVDAIGAFPPVMESHVEMDGAWALYEAWLKVLTGEADSRWPTVSASRPRATCAGCSPCNSTPTCTPRCGRTR